MLSLMEELLLLALDDEKGTISSSVQTPLNYGLPGAGLSELVLDGKLHLDEKQRVVVVNASPTGQELLDEMLAKIQEAHKPKSMKDWVMTFGNGGIKKLQTRLEERLVANGTLRLEEGRFLQVFPWHHYPTVDGAPEAETIATIRSVLLDEEEPTPRAAVLVSLVVATRMLDKLFGKDERKRAEKRAKEIAKGTYAGQAVNKAVEEVSAAMIAVMATVIASSTASNTSS